MIVIMEPPCAQSDTFKFHFEAKICNHFDKTCLRLVLCRSWEPKQVEVLMKVGEIAALCRMMMYYLEGTLPFWPEQLRLRLSLEKCTVSTNASSNGRMDINFHIHGRDSSGVAIERENIKRLHDCLEVAMVALKKHHGDVDAANAMFRDMMTIAAI